VRLLVPIVAVVVLLAGPRAASAAKAVDGVINLNTAPAEVLGLLPGIGPAKAAEIATYRKRHPFRTVDELVRIKGIGRKMVRRWRAHLAVAGPTTATAVMLRPGEPAPAPPPPPVPHPPPRPICVRPPSALPSRVARRGATERWPAHAACLRPR
jgi:competence protein ComEA